MSVPNKNNSASGRIENGLKILSFLITAGSLFWGVYQYKIDNERSFRKYVFDKQSDTYSKYLTLCAELANTDKDSTGTHSFIKQYSGFENIHFGEMTLVQDTSVFSIATKFYVELNKFRQRNSATTNNDLQIIIETLSKNCRLSLRNTWTADFKKIFTK